MTIKHTKTYYNGLIWYIELDRRGIIWNSFTRCRQKNKRKSRHQENKEENEHLGWMSITTWGQSITEIESSKCRSIKISLQALQRTVSCFWISWIECIQLVSNVRQNKLSYTRRNRKVNHISKSPGNALCTLKWILPLRFQTRKSTHLIEQPD